VLLPFQLIGITFKLRLQRTIPHLYHRALCILIGVRIREVGQRSAETPLLILSNHVSWLDICVITALAPVVFVAKSEVARWPVFGWLAKCRRTIFIDRRARHQTGAATREIAIDCSAATPSCCSRRAPRATASACCRFRSALIAPCITRWALPQIIKRFTVQPMSMAYVGLGGVPLGRALRERVAWYGDAELMPHLIGVLGIRRCRRHRELGRRQGVRHGRRPQADRPRRGKIGTPHDGGGAAGRAAAAGAGRTTGDGAGTGLISASLRRALAASRPA